MKRFLIVLFIAHGAESALAESIVPKRTIRAEQVIAAEDLGVIEATIDGGFANPEDVIGQEARRTLYANRAILPDDIGPPATVARNQIVPLSYRAGTLFITTEGRALSRGAEGETIRVMNLSSRTTVSGTIKADGTVTVGP